ncbi:MAG: hypothetical protein GWP15_00540 [Nitrospirae bacterium]|nr:hypothetical protein [Nitrospirota bacterium]
MGNKNSKNEDLRGFAEINLQVISDSQLYQKCKEYGGNARLWMRKFEGLLPEVCRRRLHRHRGFTSIHEFAAKLAGMSHPKVDQILQLSAKLEDKPKLREAFESGEVGYSKVVRVAYVAKPETDGFWAEKVQTESQFVLNLSVSKEREKNKTVFKHSFQSDLSVESGFRRGRQVELPAGNTVEIMLGDEVAEASIPARDEGGILEPAWGNLNFHVDPKVERKFRALKQKLEKQSGETMSHGEVLGELIKMIEKAKTVAQAEEAEASVAPPTSQPEQAEVVVVSAQRAQTEKQVTIKVCPDCAEKKAREAKESKSRTVPIVVKRLVLARQNNQCARADCTHPPSDLHHINGYALTKSHSPEGLEYLCENHHKLAHAQHEFVQVYRRE